MDSVIEAGGLRDTTASEHRNKPILLDVTHADQQGGGTHADGQRGPKRISYFRFRGAQPESLRSFGGQLSFHERAQLLTGMLSPNLLLRYSFVCFHATFAASTYSCALMQPLLGLRARPMYVFNKQVVIRAEEEGRGFYVFRLPALVQEEECLKHES